MCPPSRNPFHGAPAFAHAPGFDKAELAAIPDVRFRAAAIAQAPTPCVTRQGRPRSLPALVDKNGIAVLFHSPPGLEIKDRSGKFPFANLPRTDQPSKSTD